MICKNPTPIYSPFPITVIFETTIGQIWR